MTAPRKPFGRRNLPEIEPPPPVLHAPEGLGGPEPHPPRRLRSLAVVLTGFGLIALIGVWQAQKNRCAEDDSNTANCNSSGHGGGGHGGGFVGGAGGSNASGGADAEGAHGAAFGGFGGTGEGGAHGGGGGE
jgi:hypothetical protein